MTERWQDFIAEELHRDARKNFPRCPVFVKGLYDLYQGDIVEMRPYADENEGYKYLVTIIDAFSKKAWAFPSKTKTGKEVAKLLESFFSKLKKTPRFFQVDKGTEFYNQDVTPVLEKYGVKLYSSFTEKKASIVERFNKTFKNWMWLQFSKQGSYEWLGLVDDLLEKYNSRVHRTIGLAPNNVNEKNEKYILERLIKKRLPVKKKKNKFKVGDYVRISKYKHVFEKGYTPNWTKQLFIIKKVQKTVPVTYKLIDTDKEALEGAFYEEELIKTKYKDIYLVDTVIRKTKTRALVKWMGYSDKHNSWVPLKDIQG